MLPSAFEYPFCLSMKFAHEDSNRLFAQSYESCETRSKYFTARSNWPVE